MNRREALGIGSASILLGVGVVRADESLAGKACRSVHLNYLAPSGTVFYNEVEVKQSAPGTYFCVCGWNKGYFGIQEQGRGKKVAIFSVWDSRQDDPGAVDDGDRVKLLHQGDRVRVGRFGGEGTGGQSFVDLEWKAGETYRFLVGSKISGNRTEYSGWLRRPSEQGWKHLVTFSTITGGKPLSGYYSFVEDFQRDGKSTQNAREAVFGGGWVKSVDGDWHPLRNARFTADKNPALSIDAGPIQDRFFLKTGGQTTNAATPLGQMISVDRPTKDAEGPHGLPDLTG